LAYWENHIFKGIFKDLQMFFLRKYPRIDMIFLFKGFESTEVQFEGLFEGLYILQNCVFCSKETGNLWILIGK